jgi:hypothetical protein
MEEALRSNPTCRCEELGLRAGMPVGELIDLEAGCTSSLNKAKLNGTKATHSDRGFVCPRLDTIRRRYGK